MAVRTRVRLRLRADPDRQAAERVDDDDTAGPSIPGRYPDPVEPSRLTPPDTAIGFADGCAEMAG